MAWNENCQAYYKVFTMFNTSHTLSIENLPACKISDYERKYFQRNIPILQRIFCIIQVSFLPFFPFHTWRLDCRCLFCNIQIKFYHICQNFQTFQYRKEKTTYYFIDGHIYSNSIPLHMTDSDYEILVS